MDSLGHIGKLFIEFTLLTPENCCKSFSNYLVSLTSTLTLFQALLQKNFSLAQVLLQISDIGSYFTVDVVLNLRRLERLCFCACFIGNQGQERLEDLLTSIYEEEGRAGLEPKSLYLNF